MYKLRLPRGARGANSTEKILILFELGAENDIFRYIESGREIMIDRVSTVLDARATKATVTQLSKDLSLSLMKSETRHWPVMKSMCACEYPLKITRAI